MLENHCFVRESALGSVQAFAISTPAWDEAARPARQPMLIKILLVQVTVFLLLFEMKIPKNNGKYCGVKHDESAPALDPYYLPDFFQK